MLQPVFLISCLLLSFISSAPLSPASDSSSDEDLQFPVVGVASPQAPPTASKAPPRVIVKVEDTKRNITLSFAIFILAEEEEEGSGTDGRGRSENSSSNESDDIIGDDSSDIQPMTSLPPTETETSSQLAKKEVDEENLSSEEMMSDQPMVSFSDEDADGFKSPASDGNQRRTDGYFISAAAEANVSQTVSSTESREVYSQPDDQNNTRSEGFTNDSNSREINHQPARTTSDPVSQEVASSSSEKTSNQDGVGSSRAGISEGFGFGSRLQEVFHSIQEVVDLLSVNQGVMGAKGSRHKVLGSTPNSLSGRQTGFSLSSDESDDSSESVSFGKLGSSPKNQTGVSPDPDSDESLEATSYSLQQGTGSRDSTVQVSGPTTNSSSDLSSPDSGSKEVQDTSGKSIQVDNGANLNPVSPDQDATPTMLSIPADTVSKESSRSFSQVSLNSDSSEESQESVGTQEVVGSTTSSPGLPRVGSPEASSSSEEVPLVLSSSSSPLLISPTESGSSEESGSKSDPPGLHPDPIPTSDSNLSPESNPSFGLNFSSSSEISHEKSEESLTIKVRTDTNSDVSREANPASTGSIAVSSEASMDTKPDSGVKDVSTDSSNDVSIEADPTAATVYSASLPSMHVSSGASKDAKTHAGSELSVEEDDDASMEATAVSVEPTATTECRTNPPDSAASTDAIANVERGREGSDVSTQANSPAPNQHASSEEKMASPPPPPRRRRPYRFGFLGPLSHSHGNQSVYLNPLRDFFNSRYDADEKRRQQAGSRQSGRKQTRVSVAAVANAARSSSEETR